MSTLHETIKKKDFEKVKILIEKGTNVNAYNGTGFTPLRIAVAVGDIQIAKFLISSGADVNLPDGTILGYSPLHSAIDNENEEITKFLISVGADVNAYNKRGTTPLLMAASKANIEIMKSLIIAGADVNANANNFSSDSCLTPLQFAADNRNTEGVRLLIQSGARTDIKNRSLHQKNAYEIATTIKNKREELSHEWLDVAETLLKPKDDSSINLK